MSRDTLKSILFFFPFLWFQSVAYAVIVSNVLGLEDSIVQVNMGGDEGADLSGQWKSGLWAKLSETLSCQKLCFAKAIDIDAGF
jgi:hypothetical protein